jgi:ribonucleoside-diphosphate reductase alpha chain
MAKSAANVTAAATPKENNEATPARGLRFDRYFTPPGSHPYNLVEWERRTAAITNEKGKLIFEQKDVEVPRTWSQLATNVVAQKYFRGHLNGPDRESSVRQLVDRAVDTLAGWGRDGGYFASEADASNWAEELRWLLVTQHASFNSPVWFNIGVPGRSQQAAACFINSVEDKMESILELAKTEGMLFKFGSGTGSNLSVLRSSKETLAGGGTASGPVSFMRGYDSFAGSIKSGGTTRRAAKMVILNADHPDILEFINCKAVEEKKAWALIEAGYDAGFNVPGGAYDSVQFQNANHSVRVTDEFMQAVEEDDDWTVNAVTDGRPLETYKARDVWKSMADAAWICGDPGVQFDTTIQGWNCVPNTGRINATNPCSEFVFVDDTACNLLSLNLLKYQDDQGRFDVERFQRAVDVCFTGQEILVSNASYPTPAITQNSERLRPLGLGYANLGALLMSMGLAYDSDEGRDFAGAVTAIMTGRAYAQSARMAEVKGPFSEFAVNREPMLKIMRRHRAAARKLPTSGEGSEVFAAARSTWDDAVALGERHGYRNAQATVLAPTGCLVGETLVMSDRGLVHLRNLGDTEGKRWQTLRATVATDEGPRDATRFYVNGHEPVVTVETGRGYRIRGTTAHRVKVATDSGSWDWRRLSDVRPGDRVPLMLGGLVGTPRPSTLPSLGGQPRRMDEDLAELVGYFVVDGALGRDGIRFSVVAPDLGLVKRLSHLARALFGVQPSITDNGEREDVTLRSAELAGWWQACGFAGPADGRPAQIPDAVLETNDTRVYLAFMRGLFGSARAMASGVLALPRSCEQLGREVQTLMLALGLVTTIRTDQAAVMLQLPGQLDDSTTPAVTLGSPLVRLAPARPGAASQRSTTQLLERPGAVAVHQELTFFYETVTSASLGAEQPTFDLSVPENVTYVANGFISHNTIGLMMDCDTTGIEPDLALVKYKKLVGGGLFKIVNGTVPQALRRLAYSEEQVTEIVGFIDEHDTIEGAPHLQDQHLRVFDCAFKPVKGTRSIAPMGHVHMMAAVQPFISGSQSKTVNMPHEATVDEIADTYLESWKLGLKCIAIYRDGCKRSQPLSTSRDEDKSAAAPATEVPAEPKPVRRRLPAERRSLTHKFEIQGHEGYITVGLYDDGTPGEIFLRMSKEGSTISGFVDTFATQTSVALQYGVPLRTMVDKFSHVRFEPSGFTKNPEIPIAKSVIDYLFRWLASRFLDAEDQEAVGVLRRDTAPEPAPAPSPVTPPRSSVQNGYTNGAQKLTFVINADSPACSECGSITIRSGTCYKCMNCGATTGCG